MKLSDFLLGSLYLTFKSVLFIFPVVIFVTCWPLLFAAVAYYFHIDWLFFSALVITIIYWIIGDCWTHTKKFWKDYRNIIDNIFRY